MNVSMFFYIKIFGKPLEYERLKYIKCNRRQVYESNSLKLCIPSLVHLLFYLILDIDAATLSILKASLALPPRFR